MEKVCAVFELNWREDCGVDVILDVRGLPGEDVGFGRELTWTIEQSRT